MLSSKFNKRSIAIYKKHMAMKTTDLQICYCYEFQKNVTGIREIKPMQKNLNSVAVEWITCNYYV